MKFNSKFFIVAMTATMGASAMAHADCNSQGCPDAASWAAGSLGSVEPDSISPNLPDAKAGVQQQIVESAPDPAQALVTLKGAYSVLYGIYGVNANNEYIDQIMGEADKFAERSDGAAKLEQFSTLYSQVVADLPAHKLSPSATIPQAVDETENELGLNTPEQQQSDQIDLPGYVDCSVPFSTGKLAELSETLSRVLDEKQQTLNNLTRSYCVDHSLGLKEFTTDLGQVSDELNKSVGDMHLDGDCGGVTVIVTGRAD